jgi:hypothetical protein
MTKRTASAVDFASELDLAMPSFDAENPQAISMAEEKKPALKPAWATVKLPEKLSFREKPTKRIFYDYSEVENAIRLLTTLPAKGETIHAVMDSHFKGIDLVPAVCRLAKAQAKEVIVTTLGFNRRDAACLCEMKQRGDIQELSMVCSNFFAEKDRGAYDYARERFVTVGARLGVSRNHSKLILFDFGTTFYTVESSANLRSCMNFEQFALTNSKPLFDFHKSWVTKML